MAMTGGVGSSNPADKEIQLICDKVKADVEKELSQTFSTFLASQYRSQLVAGVNYFIKVNVGEENWIHIKVYQPLPHEKANPKLTGVQQNKSEQDSIDYF